LSRIVNPDSGGRERARLSEGIVLAVRELASRNSPDAESHDLAAFIALALAIISQTIDSTVAAWERRDYWVKADKFRMDWAWCGLNAEKMKQAILNDDWGMVAKVATQVAQKLSKVNVSSGHRLGRPWVGAWNELRNR
jgi:hypothetical protein